MRQILNNFHRELDFVLHQRLHVKLQECNDALSTHPVMC